MVIGVMVNENLSSENLKYESRTHRHRRKKFSGQ